MATLEEFGASTGTGILHPQLRHRFRVQFTVQPTIEFSEEEQARFKGAINALQLQATKVVFPPQLFHGINEDGKIITSNHEGLTYVTFQEDITNLLSSGLYFLMEQVLCQRIHLDMKVDYLDGNNNAIKSVLLPNIKFGMITPSKLDYAPSSNELSGKVTDNWAPQPREGYPYTTDVRLTMVVEEASNFVTVAIRNTNFITTIQNK